MHINIEYQNAPSEKHKLNVIVSVNDFIPPKIFNLKLAIAVLVK